MKIAVSPTKRALLQFAAISLFAGGLSGPAFADDAAAVAKINAFYAALLENMRAGATLNFAGRAQRLGPVVDRTFDVPTMTRFAVGPTWLTTPPAVQASLTAAFRRLVIANYAHNFDSFSGERFVVEPAVQVRGVDRFVQSRLLPAHGAPVQLNYRMREGSGGWQIIDVYYQNAISELTTRRSDFSSILRDGGAQALVTHINRLADRLG